MTKQTEALKLALEALENHPGNYKLSKAECAEYGAVEDALREALEQQVMRETAPNGATHIQPQQGAFYKRVDEKWYVWSRMEDGRPHRWYISPGTVESCLKPISAATEQPQGEQEHGIK